MGEERRPAVLLVGPTGSGKTPLGALMEKDGLWGKTCRHFDFGHHLRRISKMSEPPPWLEEQEREFIRSVLAAGALLEDNQFVLAEKILRAFMAECGIERGELIALNGLPRHVGQAEAVASIVEVVAVIELLCTPEVAIERVRANAGGDRDERADDGPKSVLKKLGTFARRTIPLVEYYRERGVPIYRVEVGAHCSPERMLTTIESGRKQGFGKGP